MIICETHSVVEANRTFAVAETCVAPTSCCDGAFSVWLTKLVWNKFPQMISGIKPAT